jgi:hypothetical protein
MNKEFENQPNATQGKVALIDDIYIYNKCILEHNELHKHNLHNPNVPCNLASLLW